MSQNINKHSINDFYKIVTPKPTVTTQANNLGLSDPYVSFTNSAWLQRMLQGSGSRQTQYNEFEFMDSDSEISRGLDVIAEEMVGNNPDLLSPIEIVYNNSMPGRIDINVTTTVETALHFWVTQFDLRNRLFKICRNTIKYGDCFFFRVDKSSPWIYVHPKHVLSAITAEDDITTIVGWYIKQDENHQFIPDSLRDQFNLDQHLVHEHGSLGVSSSENAFVVPTSNVLRFTTNDSMSDTAPFGESVLRSVYRAQKQKELLEDSIIIYRIQRAPEKRVFYIDTGNMPVQRQRAFLENFKNEIRQRKVPSTMDGTNQVESVYNVQSINEDFFFAVSESNSKTRVETLPGGCLAMDTEIPLVDGRTITLEQCIAEYLTGKTNYAYSINIQTGEVAPGLISWAGVTNSSAETVTLTLSTGDVVTLTADHPVPVWGKGYVKAGDLKADDVLVTFFKRGNDIYDHSLQIPVSSDSLAERWSAPLDIDSDEIDTAKAFRTIFAYVASLYRFDDTRRVVELLNNQPFFQQLWKQYKEQMSYQEEVPFGVTELDNILLSIDNGYLSWEEFKESVYEEHSQTYERYSEERISFFSHITNKLLCGSDDIFDDETCEYAYEVGFSSVEHVLDEIKSFSTRVVRTVQNVEPQTVGTLTIDTYETMHNFHNFAIGSGIYVKNSGLGELADLDYFQNKVFRALRIPLSYMSETGQTNDGRTGIAYISELRFGLYIQRLQSNINDTLDKEFKDYLLSTGVLVDSSLFRLRLPSPQNFGVYRQQQLNMELLNTYTLTQGNEVLSKRYALERFLQMSEAEILRNERMVMEEKGINFNDETLNRAAVYNPELFADIEPPSDDTTELEGVVGRGGGGGFPGGGGDIAGDLDLGEGETGEEPLGGEEIEPETPEQAKV